MNRIQPRKSLYQNLWKERNSDTKQAHQSPEIALIEDVCLRVQLSHNYEEYVQKLCEGMIMLLNAKISQNTLKKHKLLMSYINQMGDQIIDNSNYESDQQYLGIFVKLRSSIERFKVKFYQLVKGLMHQVLEQGIDLSNNLKNRIRHALKTENQDLYQAIFAQNPTLYPF